MVTRYDLMSRLGELMMPALVIHGPSRQRLPSGARRRDRQRVRRVREADIIDVPALRQHQNTDAVEVRRAWSWPPSLPAQNDPPLPSSPPTGHARCIPQRHASGNGVERRRDPSERHTDDDPPTQIVVRDCRRAAGVARIWSRARRSRGWRR